MIDQNGLVRGCACVYFVCVCVCVRVCVWVRMSESSCARLCPCLLIFCLFVLAVYLASLSFSRETGVRENRGWPLSISRSRAEAIYLRRLLRGERSTDAYSTEAGIRIFLMWRMEDCRIVIAWNAIA